MIISLGDVDRDKFELHLRNLLNQHLGVGFVTGKVQIKFHHVADKELCEIETSPAKEPVIVKLKDRSGQGSRSSMPEAATHRKRFR